LTSYVESNDSVKLSGVAYTEDLIAEFMRSIQASNDYTGVELVVSEQKEISGTKLKGFELAFKLKPTVTTVEPTK
jgi:type IV pilus assembly protein PilN